MDFKCKPLVAIVIIAMAALSGCQENEIEVKEDVLPYRINYYFEYENLTDTNIEISSCDFSTDQGPGLFSDQDIWPEEASILPANSRILLWPFGSVDFVPADSSFALRLATGEQVRILAGWTEAQYAGMPNVIVYGAGYTIFTDKTTYFEYQ